MAEVRDLNGRPAIFIEGKAYPPMMATIRTMKDGQEIIFDREYFKNLGESGVKIYFLICDTVWLKPNAIELFETEARALLDAVPDAYIIPRIGMHPTNEWIEAHPEECVRYGDGRSPAVHLFSESYETDIPAHYSLASSKWREDAGKALEETWQKLMKLPYADRIVGCFLAAGGTSEWYYMLPVVDQANQTVLDHSEAFKRNFSAYLREKYGDDKTLRKHWKNPDVTLDNPTVPAYEKHYYVDRVDADCAIPPIQMYSNSPIPPPFGNGTNYGSFADLDKNLDVYDFYRAWSYGTAGSVLHFAEIIKRLTPDKLVGAFYGSQGCTQFLQNGSAGGTVRVLNSPYIDFLAAPGVYENRLAGGFEGEREVQDSFALHNKIYIVEQDTRTHAENRHYMHLAQIYDLTDTENVMKREFGRTVCEDVQAWWFDQLIGGRRYKFPEVYQLIARQQEIAREAYALDRQKTSEIALIFDEESMQAISQQSTRDAVEMFRNYEISRVGAPCDQYYHNDMADPKMPSYKLYVFMNVYVLTEEERKVIREKLRRDHAVALWLYAPGFADPMADEGKLSVENIRALTGIDCAVLCDKYDCVFRWNGEDHQLTENLDRRALHGQFNRRRRLMLVGQRTKGASYWDPYLYPMIHSIDPEAKNVAYFLTSGLPAVSVKEEDGFTSILHGSKFLDSDTLRAVARYAGCHIYAQDDDVLFASKNYVTLHASEGGKKTLRFPKKVSPYEVYEKKFYAHGVTELAFDMYLGETKMFRLVEE